MSQANRVKLAHLVRFGNGQDWKEVAAPDGDFPVYGSGGEFGRASDFLYDGDAILFGRKGTVDRPIYVDEKFWTVDTMYYAVPNKDKCLGKYLFYWATTIPFATITTNTALPSVTAMDLSQLYVPLPPLETQRRIADYLDRETTEIDAAVADLDKYVELLEKRKWQQLNEILENSLHSRVRLSVAAKMKTGTTPSTLLENEEGVPWLKPDGLGVQSTGQRIDFEMLRESLLSPGGTTYVCGIGTIGKVGYSEEPAITNQQITALTPVLNIIPKLFYYSVLTLTDWLRRTAPGSTLSILNNARLGTYSVRIPVLDVQQTVLAEIESLFHETDQIVAESTTLRDLLLKRRSVLITEVVTGRKQV